MNITFTSDNQRKKIIGSFDECQLLINKNIIKY